MDIILIEAIVNKKHIKFFNIFAIFYFVTVIMFPFGIFFLLIASGLKNQKLIVTENNKDGDVVLEEVKDNDELDYILSQFSLNANDEE